uniref:Uncharacterized protein n=1 Tax=Panagrolaimus sp. PS1159 TaxID=55785 RepID=A0AC35G312_9BILA
MIKIRVLLSLFLYIYLVNAQSEYRVPDPPENVRIKTTSNSATLWWDPPPTAGEILVRGYTISYGIETPSKKIVIEGVETNSFTINDLKPNITYVFAICAYNEADGEDSEKVLLTAKTAGAKKDQFFKLPAPSDISITAISPRDIDVSWKDTIPEKPEDNRLDLRTRKRFYLIHYSPIGSNSPPKKLSTEKTRALITNLNPSTEYQIMIRTILPTNSEESPWKSTAPLQFRRQSSHSDPSLPKTREENAGHFMVIQSTRDPTEKFGRLYSPIWTFDDSVSFCLIFWDYIRKDSFGTFSVSILYEGDSINMAIPIYKVKLEKIGRKDKWHKILVQSKLSKNRSFQVIFEVRKSAPRQRFWIAIDDILAHGGHCPNDGLRYDKIAAVHMF